MSLYGSIVSLHGSRLSPPCLPGFIVSPPQLPAFAFDVDPDPVFHCDADLAPASKNDEDPCGSRSAILLLIMFFEAVFIYMFFLPLDTRWASTEMLAAGRIYDSA